MFHRLRLIFLLVLLGSSAVTAQTTCTAKLAELQPALELRGFRLGMTHEQVKARVPQVAFGRTDDLGVSKVSINPFFDPKFDQASFAEVRTISLDFLDGRLTSLWIGFEQTFKWKTTDEFVKGISPALGVPADWVAKGRNLQLKCSDFELSVSMIGGGPSLRIVDLPAAQTLAERRQARQDAATAAEETPAESHAVIGDSRNKIYYPPDCEALKAVPDQSRMSFGTPEEAVKAGYKAAAGCRQL